ncbi:hypothetical protein G7059_00030 [Erysipelothrix sp. HDW6A]|uniref:hypothetical protein n=1 Tax=Erysipelothrix sp. HDW6A TaxID=2714928 RepID=UPI00140E88A7|nr:hypothetical protein [Erysipelothrix sp. HDW6A]QIK56342.1 hypothetical protein G7059_00030 [Erysipelothrix sp. HDW6A]
MKSSVKERNELIKQMINEGHGVIIVDPKTEYEGFMERIRNHVDLDCIKLIDPEVQQ